MIEVKRGRYKITSRTPKDLPVFVKEIVKALK